MTTQNHQWLRQAIVEAIDELMQEQVPEMHPEPGTMHALDAVVAGHGAALLQCFRRFQAVLRDPRGKLPLSLNHLLADTTSIAEGDRMQIGKLQSRLRPDEAARISAAEILDAALADYDAAQHISGSELIMTLSMAGLEVGWIDGPGNVVDLKGHQSQKSERKQKPKAD